MEFIRCYNDVNLKKKLLLIYILNVNDIIFTFMLLDTGFFIEANIIMRNIISYPILGIFVKVILVFVLIFFLSCKIKYANIRQIIMANKIFCSIIIIYFLINISHLIWILKLALL